MSKQPLVLLALEERWGFERTYLDMLNALRSEADVQKISVAIPATELFTGTARPTVLVVDSALSLWEYHLQKEQVSILGIVITEGELTIINRR